MANRTIDRAHALAARCPEVIRPIPFDGDDLCRAAAESGLLVNATSLGMAGKGEFSDLDFLRRAPDGAVMYDLVYHPRCTRLLQAAAALGLALVFALQPRHGTAAVSGRGGVQPVHRLCAGRPGPAGDAWGCAEMNMRQPLGSSFGRAKTVAYWHEKWSVSVPIRSINCFTIAHRKPGAVRYSSVVCGSFSVRPYSSVMRRIFLASAGVSSPFSSRHVQLPPCVPGVFMRCPAPRPR